MNSAAESVSLDRNSGELHNFGVNNWFEGRIIGQGCLAAAILLCLGSCQPEDHLVGVWKLDKGKSPHYERYMYNPLPVYESITITHHDSNFTLTYTSLVDNGGGNDRRFATDMNRRLVTDMKGDDANRTPVNEERIRSSGVRMRRKDANSFAEEGAIYEIEYTVSSDGRTMTVRQQPYLDNAFVRVLVYEKVR